MIILSPLNSQICTRLPQVVENRAYELVQVISPTITLPQQFPLLWFENHLRAVLQLPAHLLQLLPSATKLFGCLRGAQKGPASAVLHKRTERMKEITGSVPLSSPSLNSTCELYSYRAFP